MLSLFTGVKALNAVCSVVRNKLMAVFVGPVGVGLTILYNTVLDIISQACRLSIDQSSIRSITGDFTENHVRSITTVVSRWCWWLGLAGMVTVIVLSPLLSFWTFDTVDRWWTFVILSPAPLLGTLTMGRQALLQGLGHLAVLARASMAGIIGATVISSILIVWLKIDAIVPMLLAFFVIQYMAMMVMSPRLPGQALPNREVWRRGMSFIKLGAVISLSLIIAQVFYYIFILYLNREWDTDSLGLFQSGYTLVNTYMGMVLAGVWIEYFPRMGRAAHSSRAVSTLVSNQIGLLTVIFLPMVVVFIAVDSWVIDLLYSAEFESVSGYASFAIIGVLLRSFTLCMSIMILVRGAGKLFLVTESLSAVTGLVLNIAGYHLGGLTGLGIAYFAWYVVYSLIILRAYRHHLGYQLRSRVVLYVLAAIALSGGVLALKLTLGWLAALIPAIIISAVCLRRLIRLLRH